ncbi:hypothetical protein B2G71_20600 [Novosphingobium sp. PC22D]|nr:hypothetical protein B2G71_20600 [Novosphingobium sp. PC22D]
MRNAARHGAARLRDDRSGGVALIAALALPVVIGATGLAFDLNQGLQQRVANQRAADVAALGAAMAFQDSSNASVLQPTAADIVTANGITGATVNAVIVNDFPESGDQAVRVTVTTEVPYSLARVLGFTGTYDVGVQSTASLTSEGSAFAAPCFLALSDASDALKTTGGATIDAPTCAIAAFGKVANLGTRINGHDIISGGSDVENNYGTLNAESVRYAGDFINPFWNSNVPSEDKWVNQATVLLDPWAENEEMLDAMDEIGDSSNIPPISNPTTPSGSNWTFDWSHAGPVAAFWQGDGKYVVPAGNYTIGRLSVGGGINVTFQSESNITIKNGLQNGGGSNLLFGDVNLYVNGGFDTAYNNVTIGKGALWIGSGTNRFAGTTRKGDGTVIINSILSVEGGSKVYLGEGDHFFGGFNLGGGGNFTMGDGDFVAANGVTISGDTELSMGDGNVIIGPSSSNYAINLGGGARFFMGDGTFSAKGNINTVGGSRLVFGKTANHYIDGNLVVAGSVIFGRGRYTIDGNFVNGTGGTQWPYTSWMNGVTYGNTLEGVNVAGYDQAGVGVTFVLDGTVNLAGGAKSKLIAPTTSTSGAEISDLLIASLTSADTNWAAGSGNNFAGSVYLPNSKVTMSGGNTTLSAGQCFTLVASKIWATGGAAAGTACPTVEGVYAGGESTSIRLVL